MDRFEMGQEERDWLNWLKRAKDGVITQRKAAEKMGVTDRWVRELLGCTGYNQRCGYWLS